MKMIENSLFACACAFVAFLMPSCGLSANEISLTNEDNGKIISLHTQDTIKIGLSGNMTAGYSWDVVNPISSKVKLLARAYEPYQTIVAGGGGVFYFEFIAVSPGSSELIFTHGRPWEKKIAPMETFRVILVIK
jgi:predicted secreted protein